MTKQGRGHARGMLVEAAWAAARSPGPLRAFYKRIASRRGKHIAAVATARQLAMIIWQMLSKDADYIWARPAFSPASSDRSSCAPASRLAMPGGTAFDYNIPGKRAEERSRVEKAEAAYAAETSRWRSRPKRQKAVEKAAE
ncbi:hypothetical protein [Mesorhizobium sp. M6A.T.Ce.TU.002.03.1.1]|uniref:hypothetical protein n=1 Tax=Mesorhizobium sp. M6A.T.Ce.TU.002.03.1.1 TaxID=2496782 RepID=UPI001FDEBA35|nr:hypothetical protein [Mesorhizobium sp. M6A.T.Ce.TU.002.03.1.1]